jgi:transposase InsO family protein
LKKDDLPILPEEALFRYRVISEVRALVLKGQPLGVSVRQVAGQEHMTMDGKTRHVSERTIQRWLSKHKESGILGLVPKKRSTIESSRVLSPDLLSFLKNEKGKDIYATIPELLRRAKEYGLVQEDENICPSTVWRAFGRMGIDTKRHARPNLDDQLRFAYWERMQMGLSDFVHFRAGRNRLRRCAVYILDDATRRGLNVVVTTSENTEAFLKLFFETLLDYGKMDCMYTDRGPGYRSLDTITVMAQLDIKYILGRARYPEGHGKIERFNRSLRARSLRHFDGNPEIDPDLESLTLRLRHDLFEIYNHLPHESLNKETPEYRWSNSKRPLRPTDDVDTLASKFVITEERTVSNDNIVRHGGLYYEMPFGHARTRVNIYRRVLEDNALYVLHKEHMVRLFEVDIHENAITPRARKRKSKKPEPPHPITKSASMLNYDKTYGSILDADGGFSDRDQDNEGKNYEDLD